MSRKPDLVEIEVVVMDETPAAYALQNPDQDAPWKDWIWVPKSQVTLETPYQGRVGHETLISMPEWLATKTGLV